MHASVPQGRFASLSLSLSVIARVAVVALLTISAALKWEQLLGRQFITFPWWESSAAAWELVLALWLLCGAFWKAAARVAMATFALFASVSLAKAFSAHASCGCLGRVEVSPWIMLGIDLCIIFALAYGPDRPQPLSRGVIVGFSLAILVGISALALGETPSVRQVGLQSESPSPGVESKIWATVLRVYLGHRGADDRPLAGQITLTCQQPFRVRAVECAPPQSVSWKVQILTSECALLRIESAIDAPGEHRAQLAISAVSGGGSVTHIPVALFWTAGPR